MWNNVKLYTKYYISVVYKTNLENLTIFPWLNYTVKFKYTNKITDK